MHENDIIFVNGIDAANYDIILNEAIQYAIISIPFTYDRMDISNLKQKIINIAKGKVAEGLFLQFCRLNGLPIDTHSCTTPFYQADHRDFVLMEREWDIKNNFIYHSGDELKRHAYVDLPALVPNRGTWDQWGKRDQCYLPESKGAGYIFTFLKNLDRYKRHHNFFDIDITPEQDALLHKLYKRYQGKHQERAPFDDDRFWEKFYESSPEQKFNFSVDLRPHLVIAACATKRHWERFVDSGAGNRPYPNIQPATLVTTINNRMCPVSRLPAFVEIFPKLREHMVGAEFVTK